MFENGSNRERYTGYFLPAVDIKDCNVMIGRRIFFDQLTKNNIRTYKNISKFTIGQGDHYRTVCLLDYPFFKENYMLIAIDFSKQQAPDATWSESNTAN